MLEDFEGPADALSRRQSAFVNGRAVAASDEVSFALAPVGSEGSGKCLHVRYGFASPDTEEVGVRIDLGAVDASRYDHLVISVRGDAAAGFDTSMKVGFRRRKAGHARLFEDATGIVIGIRDEWHRFYVPLNRIPGIRDWSKTEAFFIALERARSGTGSGGWCIDDVSLLDSGIRGPTIYDDVVIPRKEAWERSLGGRQSALPRVRERLVGWPERRLVDRSALPTEERDLLRRIAFDTWRGIEALTDREHRLPIDHVRFGKTLAPEDATIGDYTSATNIGLHLIAIVAASDLGFVSPAKAKDEITALLDTLDRLERHAGFFFNFYDTTTLERSSNFLSFVDSSWLTAGFVVVRAAFPELGQRVTALIDEADYAFFYDPVAGRMSHGHYVNVPVTSPYHYGALYTEARLGSLIAIGKGDVPDRHWYRLIRSFPAEDDWQRQVPKGRRAKTVDGHRIRGGWYQWRDFRYVPSWGGSMFEALMPTLAVDERRHAPKSLGRNDETHVAVQRIFATEELLYPVWGLSPAAMPRADSYGEYGIEPLGVLGYPGGAVAPYAAVLALDFAPEEGMANLRRLVERYDVYGEYGLYDAVDPLTGDVAHAYLVLDQAMILIALTNHLSDGSIRRHFESDPIAKRALPILAAENFFD